MYIVTFKTDYNKEKLTTYLQENNINYDSFENLDNFIIIEEQYLPYFNNYIDTISISHVDNQVKLQNLTTVESKLVDYDSTIFKKAEETFLNLLSETNSKKSIYWDLATKKNDNWGLSRISRLKNDFYGYPYVSSYEFNKTGKNVDIYIIDTGINMVSFEFNNRVEWLYSYDPNIRIDDHGHGTHVASVSGGIVFGIAKLAKLYAVKVMDRNGSGSVLNILKGFDTVLKHHKNKIKNNISRPSVVNFSVYTNIPEIGMAVSNLIDNGVVCCVAAGNDSRNLNDPDYLNAAAEVTSAITVGASDIEDKNAYFSNYGSLVDVFAPGVNILAVVNGESLACMSGTSMASPHCTGTVALLLEDKNIFTTKNEVLQIQDLLKSMSKPKINLTQNAKLTNTTNNIINIQTSNVTEPYTIQNKIFGTSGDNRFTLDTDIDLEIDLGSGNSSYYVKSTHTGNTNILDNIVGTTNIINYNKIYFDNNIIKETIDGNILTINLKNNNFIKIYNPSKFMYIVDNNQMLYKEFIGVKITPSLPNTPSSPASEPVLPSKDNTSVLFNDLNKMFSKKRKK